MALWTPRRIILTPLMMASVIATGWRAKGKPTLWYSNAVVLQRFRLEQRGGQQQKLSVYELLKVMLMEYMIYLVPARAFAEFVKLNLSFNTELPSAEDASAINLSEQPMQMSYEIVKAANQFDALLSALPVGEGDEETQLKRIAELPGEMTRLAKSFGNSSRKPRKS